jgi:hypothetical protein
MVMAIDNQNDNSFFFTRFSSRRSVTFVIVAVAVDDEDVELAETDDDDKDDALTPPTADDVDDDDVDVDVDDDLKSAMPSPSAMPRSRNARHRLRSSLNDNASLPLSLEGCHDNETQAAAVTSEQPARSSVVSWRQLTSRSCTTSSCVVGKTRVRF